MSEWTPPEQPQPEGNEWPAAPLPTPGPPKRKFRMGFFLLGFFSPVLWTILVAWLASFVSTPLELVYGACALFFVAYGIMFFAGRRSGDDRLRSFGLGGLVAFGAVLLFGLLIFGSCYLLLTNPV